MRCHISRPTPADVTAADTLVVGAGYTGRRLLEKLGDRAAGLSRRADADHRVSAFDLDGDGPLPIEPPKNYAIAITVPPRRDGPSEPRLERLLDALGQAPTRIVYLSTTGVYGDRGGATVDETTAPNPGTARAKRRLAAESLLASRCGIGTDLLILRVPGIYGPSRLGQARIAAREPVLCEADANPGNRIHVDDLVRCLIAALAPTVPAGIYNVGDGDTRSSTWFAGEVARQCGLEPPPTVGRDEAEAQFSAQRLSFLRESRRVELLKMHDVLEPGIRYRDAADGIAASLAEEQAGLG